MFNLPISTLISRALTLIIAFTIHEFAHAWTATMYGDETPRLNGRLTLNPISHLDPIGSLMLLIAGFGWAKPVPVNPYALERHSRSAYMWVSFAGPLSNLLLAILAAIPFRLGLLSIGYAFIPNDNILPTQEQFLFEFITINLLLMLFNLIPIAPLDGEKILAYLLPPSIARSYETLRPYGPLLLMVVIFVLPFVGIDILGMILYPVMQVILTFLLGI